MKTEKIIGTHIQQCPGGAYNVTRFQTVIRVLQSYPNKQRLEELINSDREFIRLVETSLRTGKEVEVSDRHFNNWLSLYQDSYGKRTAPLFRPENTTNSAEVMFALKQKLYQKEYGTKLVFYSLFEDGVFNKYMKATNEN